MPLRIVTRKDTGTLWITGTIRPSGSKEGSEYANVQDQIQKMMHAKKRRPSREKSSATTTLGNDPFNVVSLKRSAAI
jgi:hypothetical protein